MNSQRAKSAEVDFINEASSIVNLIHLSPPVCYGYGSDPPFGGVFRKKNMDKEGKFSKF